MISRLHSLLVGAALVLTCASTALAGQPVSLKTEVSSGRMVTLGDLFDHPGAAAAVTVGYGAPAGQDAVLDAGEVQRIAHMHGLDWSNPDGVRRIVVRSNGSNASSQGEAPAGKMIDALTYARNLAAGEIIQPADLVYEKVAAFSAPQDMPRDADALIGKMAKRPLRAGSAAASHDVAAAQLIKRDDIVQVAFIADGINLTLQGKAMSSATAGDTVSVMNTVSKKVIQAVAVGPDQAVVGPAAEELRTNPTFANPLQFATR